MRSVSRRAVIAYRAAVLGLTGDQPVPTDALLAAGVQDHPTGATARLALRLRGSDTGGALVHSVRAATHLHHRTDAGVLASALRIEDARELAKQSIGPFGAEIGAGFGAAMDEVAAVMREVMSDGVARTKGELSAAVSPKVRPELAPWCAGCGVHHVQDALFRFASLQAGLSIHVDSGSASRFVADASFEPVPSTRPGRAWCGGSCAWPAPASRNGSRPGCP